MNAFAFASLAALAYGVSDFYGGVAARRADVLRVVVWSQVIGLAILFPAAWLVGGALGVGDLGWAALAGLGAAVGLVSLYRGLSMGRAAIVAPLSGVMSGVVPAIVGFFLGERPSAATLLGFAVAAAAVWLVAGGKTDGTSGIWLGLVAGLGFGLYFVFIAPVPVEAGLWALVPARLASISVLTLLVWNRGLTPQKTARSTKATIAAVGVGDMLANVFILLALQRGPLGEGAVVSSLYPAITVVLSALILKEAVRRSQWLGLALAVVAMALIAT